MLYLHDKNIESKLNNKFNNPNLDNFKLNKVSKLYNNININLENSYLNISKNNLNTVITTNIFQTFNLVNSTFENTLIIMIGFDKDDIILNNLDNKKNNYLYFYNIDKNIFKHISIHNLSKTFFIFNFKHIYTGINLQKERIVNFINNTTNKKIVNLKDIITFIQEITNFFIEKDNSSVILDNKIVIGNIIIDDLYDYDSILVNRLFDIYNVLILSNINNRKKKLEYIYDYVCEYLDNEFKRNDYCKFCNDLCIANRNKQVIHPNFGCCYYITYKGFLRFKNKGICRNEINRKCQIKCISCKLFTCKYYRKQGIKYTTNNIFLLKHYLNSKQKLIVEHNIYTDKDKIIQKLLQRNRMPYLIYIFTKSFFVKKQRIF